LASSDRKKNRTDRSNKKRKRTDASDLKSRSDGKSGNKKDKGKVPFGKHCRRASCKQRGTHKNHAHDDCRFKDRDASSTPHKHPNLGKAPRKNKDTNPKVMSKHQHPFRLLIIMIANATFAMILIIWQTLAHKKASISTRLKPSFKLTKAL
jgi:hypothetical protein